MARGDDPGPGWNVWTGWPPEAVLTLYGQGGVCLRRHRGKTFDLSDAVGPFVAAGRKSVLFGIRSESVRRRVWTEERIRGQESNIRYDLAADGFEFTLARLKGIGLSWADEALWKLNIRA
jgi:hypothetical protein